MSPEFVEQREDEADRRIEFIVRKSGLTERVVEVIAFTRNKSLTGIGKTLLLASINRYLAPLYSLSKQSVQLIVTQ